MKAKLKQLSTIVADANDQFDKKNTLDTVLGMIDTALRKQGINADAVTVDCIPLDKKIVFLLHDDKPNRVSVAYGNKAGDIFSSQEYQLDDMDVSKVLALLVENFRS